MSTRLTPSQPARPRTVKPSSGGRWLAAVTGVLVGAATLTVLPGLAAVADTGPVQTTIAFAGIRDGGIDGLAVDGSGNVYVSDFDNNRVVEMPAGATDSSQQSALPFGTLDGPTDLAVDQAGNVYVLSFLDQRVVELPSGATDPGQAVTLPFAFPADGFRRTIAVDNAGNVYAAGGGSNHVYTLPPNATTTAQQTVITIPEATTISSLAVDSHSNLYALSGDTVLFMPAGTSGPGHATTLPINLTGTSAIIEVDTAADVFVTEPDDSTVVALRGDWTQTPAQFGLPFTGLTTPFELAIDTEGSAYTINEDQSTVQKLSNYIPTTTTVTIGSEPISGGSLLTSAVVSTGSLLLTPIGSATSCLSGGACGTAPLLHGTAGFKVSLPGAGSDTLTMTYSGTGGFADSSTSQDIVVRDASAPAFTTASPPLTAVAGLPYDYTFVTDSTPAASYSLADAPSWLSVNASGEVTGDVPADITSFTYSVVATNTFGPTTAGAFTVNVNTAAAFTNASPPLTAVAGQSYDYTFAGGGQPTASYSLGDDSADWLSIRTSGRVVGEVPSGITSFTYSVLASNDVGTAKAGPFTVSVSAAASSSADLSVSLECPHRLAAAHSAVCTMKVTNVGPDAATHAVARLLLPARLSGSHCHPICAWHHDIATWRLGRVASDTTRIRTLTIHAQRRPGRAVVHATVASRTSDPRHLHNQAVAVVQVTKRR